MTSYLFLLFFDIIFNRKLCISYLSSSPCENDKLNWDYFIFKQCDYIIIENNNYSCIYIEFLEIISLLIKLDFRIQITTFYI